MNIQKITPFGKQLLVWLFFIQAAAFAQAPTITGFSPTKVTQRTVVTITGTGFTTAMAGNAANVKFNGQTSLGITYVSATQIKVTVPEVTLPGTASNTYNFTVTTTGGTATSATQITYVPTIVTTATAKVTEIITNWNGFWQSTATSSVAANRPDLHHSLMAFRYQGTLYSTGNESVITSVLTGQGYADDNVGTATKKFKTGNFRALPVSSLEGLVSGSANLIVLGSKIDNNPNGQTATAPDVTGLKVRDVLIDGIRGLDMGTGVTNLPATSVMLFQATDIVGDGIEDATPDILVTQVAAPGSTDIFSFVDTNGNVVGNPIQVSFGNITAIGTYKTDFFTLPSGQALNTAVVNGSTTIGDNYRDYRLVAYKLSEFGITTTNKAQAAKFKVMPSGESDPAFIAYNRNSFQVPAPEITSPPTNQVSCVGSSAGFSLQVDAVGTELTFQWMHNNVNVVDQPGHISGSNTSSLSITNVTAADAGSYTCLITNPNGAALTSPVYLNASVAPMDPIQYNVCQGNTQSIEAIGLGTNLTYQWFSTTASNVTYVAASGSNPAKWVVTDPTLGSAISGATSATYSPVNTTPDITRYFYVRVSNNSQACTNVYGNAVEYKVYGNATGGTATGTGVCAGSAATITATGYTNAAGYILQWSQNPNLSSSTGWVNVTTGTGINSATLTTVPLTSTMRYRLTVTSPAGCVANSNPVTITVNTSTTWSGAIDDKWNTGGNWSCGTVPTIYTDVTIPSAPTNQPHVIGATGHAKTLTVNSGAAVTVLTNGSLDVVGAINVISGGALTVQNNASLVQDTDVANTGNVVVKKNSNPLYRLDYTMWSSPVTGQPIGAFSIWTNPERFYVFNTLTNQYNTVSSLTANFGLAVGYLIRMPNSITGGPTGTYYAGTTSYTYPGSFTGVPNNGAISKTLVTTGSAYNAVGNPYPSPISVKAFFNGNGVTVPASASPKLEPGSGIYFWRKKNDHTRSTYAVLTLAGLTANASTPDGGGSGAAGYQDGGQEMEGYFTAGNEENWLISAGQGFIVKANTALTNPQLVFDNTMRRSVPTTGGVSFFRTADAPAPSRYWLNLTNDGGFSQILLAYIDGMTTNLDHGYDGIRLAETDNTASLYTKVQDMNLAIEAKPAFDATDVVALNFAATVAGKYTFALDHADGVFEQGQSIFLKDNLTGSTHDITEGDYSFTTEAGTFANRFTIVYSQPLSTENPVLTANNVVVYQQGSTININAGAIEMTDVTIYDISGRKIYTQSGINATQTAISNLQAQHEVLVVEINTLQGKVTKKIVF